MTRYAHELEKDFADILDSFGIKYEYEPRTFVIQEDENGQPKRGFTPDFFLPEFNVYVEITSMNGSHCNKKRRKIEAIEKLYGVKTILFKKPEINELVENFTSGALDKLKICDMVCP